MEVADIWRTLKDDLVNPYRPELHYMRGPGPKWREKHSGDRSLPILTPTVTSDLAS
jgi:hypothetical protein